MRAQTRKVSAMVIAAAVLAVAPQCGTDGSGNGLDAEGVALNNRGVAHMGRFDFEAAIDAFSELAERYSDNADVQVNLGIAIMNRQGEGDEGAAKAIFDAVLESEPSHPRAAYNSGLIDLHQGDGEAARLHFVQVTETDPTDAEAFYHVGQCYMQSQQFEEALPWFERAIELDPYLRSAHYRAFQAAEQCDLALSLGTSSLVHPAAALPLQVLARRRPVLEINPEQTPLTAQATLYLAAATGVALPVLFGPG